MGAEVQYLKDILKRESMSDGLTGFETPPLTPFEHCSSVKVSATFHSRQ